MISYLIDLLVPPRASEVLLRALTLEDLRALETPEGLPYDDERVRALVWELKYYGTRKSASLAGEYLYEAALAAAAEELGMPLLVPVPMHAARQRTRGHNQTELLCEALISHLSGSVEYAPRALTRVLDTPTQQGLPKAVRLRNVKKSMLAEPDIVAGRSCIVIDDVTTTGATFAEAKRALLRAGARAVHCIALAKS
jgi:ComF family protein